MTVFRFGLILSLVSSALSLVAQRSLSMKSDLVGSSLPLGFFDPLGFSKCDAATMTKYRESELKHGRTAMLAVLGVLTQEKFHPLYDGKLSGNPLKAFADVPPLGFVQIIAVCGFLEHALQSAAKVQDNYKAGDYFGISNRIVDSNDASWVDFQTRELNNGRLAMFAIMGELVHAQITGKGPLEQWGI